MGARRATVASHDMEIYFFAYPWPIAADEENVTIVRGEARVVGIKLPNELDLC